jgi:hypothetical protein
MSTVADKNPFNIEHHPEAGAILEGNEFDLLWQSGTVAISSVAQFIGYLCPEKQRDVERIASPAALATVLARNPPLFFLLQSGELKLLDGQHRITRAHKLGMTEITIAYASEGVFADESATLPEEHGHGPSL